MCQTFWLHIAFPSKCYSSLHQWSKMWGSFTKTVCTRKRSVFRWQLGELEWKKLIWGYAMSTESRHHPETPPATPVPSDQTTLDGIHTLALSLQALLLCWELCPLAGLEIKRPRKHFRVFYISIFALSFSNFSTSSPQLFEDVVTLLRKKSAVFVV